MDICFFVLSAFSSLKCSLSKVLSKRYKCNIPKPNTKPKNGYLEAFPCNNNDNVLVRYIIINYLDLLMWALNGKLYCINELFFMYIMNFTNQNIYLSRADHDIRKQQIYCSFSNVLIKDWFLVLRSELCLFVQFCVTACLLIVTCSFEQNLRMIHRTTIDAVLCLINMS